MKAKQLKEKIYLFSEKSQLTFKVTQEEGLPVTITIEDSMPEDGEYLFAGDIIVLSALDNLQHMAGVLMEENSNNTKGKRLNGDTYFYSEKLQLFFKITQEKNVVVITIEDSLPEDGVEIKTGDDILIESLKNLQKFAKDLAEEAVNSEF